MSFHCFSNLRNLFQADLSKKLAANLVSKDFMNQECNFPKKNKIEGKCVYNNECRKVVVVYEATCTICAIQYVGNTQQFLKERMQKHFQQVRLHVRGALSKDTMARHIATHIPPPPLDAKGKPDI